MSQRAEDQGFVGKSIILEGVLLLSRKLFMVEHDSLWSQDNLWAGLNVLLNLCIIADMIISLRHTAKEERKPGKNKKRVNGPNAGAPYPGNCGKKGFTICGQL